jgi:hypothetical protein
MTEAASEYAEKMFCDDNDDIGPSDMPMGGSIVCEDSFRDCYRRVCFVVSWPMLGHRRLDRPAAY